MSSRILLHSVGRLLTTIIIDQSFGGIEAWVVSIAEYRGTQWDVIRDTSGAYLAQCYEEGPITVENVTWI